MLFQWKTFIHLQTFLRKGRVLNPHVLQCKNNADVAQLARAADL